MNILDSVRGKIWFCVNIALFGFMLATGFSLYSNHQIKSHLTHVRDLDFQLAMHSAELLNLFETQQNFYKESFLYGLPESVNKGNSLTPNIIGLMDTIIHLSHDNKPFHPEHNDSLFQVKKTYIEYAREAAETYLPLAQGRDASEQVTQLQKLAANQQNINKQLCFFAGQYRNIFDTHMSSLITVSERNSYWQTIFFLALLTLIVVVVNVAATRMLITPLAHIKEAVRKFARGQQAFPQLETMNAEDDIGELGIAFVNMAEKLKQTTVSKSYVDSILYNMNDSLIVTSNQLLIRGINQATTRLLGYSEKELIGQHISLILRGFCADELNAERIDDQDLLAHLCSNTENKLIANDKREIPVLLSTGYIKNGNSSPDGLVYVAKDITERKIAEQRLEQLAQYDFLTGLPNRMVFNDRLNHSIQLCKRERWKTGVMFIDLDRFKVINDTLGHAAGDILLKTLSNRFEICVRGNDTIARIGGDEFAVILENISTREDAANTARRLLDTTNEPIIHEGIEMPTSLSIGIAVYPLDASDTEELLEKADMAMYQAKQDGGNNYKFFTS